MRAMRWGKAPTRPENPFLPHSQITNSSHGFLCLLLKEISHLKSCSKTRGAPKNLELRAAHTVAGRKSMDFLPLQQNVCFEKFKCCLSARVSLLSNCHVQLAVMGRPGSLLEAEQNGLCDYA